MQHRFAFVDGMRGIAALGVMAMHFLNPAGYAGVMPNMHLAVDFFFILSGFIIGFAYEERRCNGLGVGEFLVIRLIRLYPLYALGMLTGSAVILMRVVVAGDVSPGQWLAASAMGLAMIPSLEWFGDRTIFPVNNPAWSLFYEILANILFIIVVPKLRNVHLLVTVALSAAALFWAGQRFGDIEGYALTDAHVGIARVAFGFSAGVLIWRWRLHERLALGPGWAIPLAAGLPVVLSLPFGLPPGLVQPLLIVVALPVFVTLSTATTAHGAVAKAALWLGRLSYPVYILHYPFVRVSGFIGRSGLADKLGGPLAVALVFAIVVIAVSAVAMVADERARAWLSARLLKSGRRPHRALAPGN